MFWRQTRLLNLGTRGFDFCYMRAMTFPIGAEVRYFDRRSETVLCLALYQKVIFAENQSYDVLTRQRRYV